MPCNIDSNSMTAEPFSFGVRLGLVFIVQTASLSAIAVLALLLYLAVNFNLIPLHSVNFISQYSTTATWKGKGEGRNVSSHMHYYLLNLLVSDLVQATGGILQAIVSV
ncbi:hypothetical protein BD779DRAFT_1485895 [Infundibulicybe gibba]|nr:hypothetical protein BD779DRAFT_1485895 [Infundibulicybe gibba]